MDNWGVIELLLIDLAALVTIWGFFQAQYRARQQEQLAWRNRMDDQIQTLKEQNQSEIANLQASCVRRDEMKDIIFPLRQDMAELRTDIRDLNKKLDKK